MTQAAQAVGGSAAAPFAAALVGVRYIGPKERKADTLLYRQRREWRRGEVLKVPPGDAAAYFKHPMVWQREEDPWDEAEPVRVMTDEQIVEAIRHPNTLQNKQMLKRGAPDIYARIYGANGLQLTKLEAILIGGDWETIETFAPAIHAKALDYFATLPREPGEDTLSTAPLDDEDAGRLSVHVPGLAQSLVQGTSESVYAKIDFNRSLLEAYPPLLAACIEAERSAKNRKEVVKRLESMAADMLSAAFQDGEPTEALEGSEDRPSDDPQTPTTEAVEGDQ